MTTATMDRAQPPAPPLPDLLDHLEIEVGPDELLPISAVAELTGTTQHTLRYYERIGLVDVGRDSAGRRAYDADSVARVVFISRLRASAMPIRDIHRYVELAELGPSTEPDRLALMVAHRERVRQQIATMQAALDVVDFKITIYGGGAAACR
jgi:DNA-binding transcriptional MerR regulator